MCATGVEGANRSTGGAHIDTDERFVSVELCGTITVATESLVDVAVADDGGGGEGGGTGATSVRTMTVRTRGRRARFRGTAGGGCNDTVDVGATVGNSWSMLRLHRAVMMNNW